MHIQAPIVELMHNEEPSHFDTVLRRKRQASSRLLQLRFARRLPSVRLAWAAFGILGGVAVALAVVVVALAYMISKRPALESLPATSATASATAAGGSQPAESSAAASDRLLDSKGFILPIQRILVSPKVSGTIVKLHIREGIHVKEGDVLAELEDIDYKAELRRAQWAVETAQQQIAEDETNQPKEIGQAEAEMERAKVELAQLQADFERTRELYFKQAASKADYESAGTRFLAAEQHVRSMDYALGATRVSLCQKVATAHTQLEEAQADLAKVRWRLDGCMVRAPISGTILKKNAEEGSSAACNVAICEMANLSELEVELPIPEVDIGKIWPGRRCQVRTEAFPDRLYAGDVSCVLPVANRDQSAIPIRVKITVPQEEEGMYLKPEMIAQVSFPTKTAMARLNESGKAPSQTRAHKPNQPTPLSAHSRSLPACG